MSNETQSGTAMVVHSEQPTQLARRAEMFTADQEQMIRDMYAPGSSDLEFAVLLATAKARRLNPILGQIHFVKRKDRAQDENNKWIDVYKWTVQVSIDGLRSKAEETKEYDGQDEPEFEDDDQGPIVARVRVYRRGFSRPFVGVARWREYAQTKVGGEPVHMWAKMPYHMLAKCAEALALRKAFPEALGGLYTADEMGQTENPERKAPRARVEQQEAPRITQGTPPARKLADVIAEAAATVELTEEATALKVSELRALMASRNVGEDVQQRALADFARRVRARAPVTTDTPELENGDHVAA